MSESSDTPRQNPETGDTAATTAESSEETERSATINPGTSRHAGLTALATAEEEHGRPVITSEVVDAADELGLLDEYADNTIRRRMRTLYLLNLAEEAPEGWGDYHYILNEAGREMLADLGTYEVDG